MNCLVYEHEGKPVEIALSDSPVTLGRGDEADHKLPTRKASRIHAQVIPRDGGWWVEDLGSSNGTGVNGRKVSRTTRLEAGDVVNVGDCELRFGDVKAPDSLARIVHDPGKGRPLVELPVHDRVTVGRRPHNTLQIEHSAVSGQHCEFVKLDDGYVLRDLDSSNGTWVNGQRVSEHTLRDGDRIVLGRKVEMEFRDPGTTDQPAQPARDAGSASERGRFEPVGSAPRPPLRGLPAAVAVGLMFGGLFAVGGWLLGGVAADLRDSTEADPKQEREPDPPLADAAFSFEGPIDERGDPEGWDAGFEAGGDTQVELARDVNDPWDGRYSLRVTNTVPGVPGTLVLQTVEARKLELGGVFEAGLYIKGEGTGRVAVALCLVGDDGAGATTIAADSFINIKGTQWTRIRMKGVPMTRLPDKPRLRLMISGGFARLWIDRLEIRAVRDDRKAGPLATVQAPGLEVRLDERRPSEVVVANDDGHEARFQPVLLDFKDDRVSEDGLWGITGADREGLRYTSMLPLPGATATVGLRAREFDNIYFEDRGVRLDWASRGGMASLAVDVTLPFPPGAELVVADRRGLPLVVDKHAVHAQAYSTITELMVNEVDLAVSFPDGAVVWLDFSRPGVVVATLRAPQESARKAFGLVVNPRPLMFARLYQRVLDEAARLIEADHYSAAIARLEYLADPSRPDGELPVIDRARRMRERVEQHRAELMGEVTEAWEIAGRERTAENVREARGVLLRYVRQFPGDDNGDLMKKLERLEEWRAEIESRRPTPEEMEQAIQNASALLEAAKKRQAEGNILMALVTLESVMQDYAHTPQVHEARHLHDEISKQMNDPIMRDRIIDKELKGIDEDLKYEDYDRARGRCLKLFRRFPDTERNRDIMKRLRAAEAAGED